MEVLYYKTFLGNAPVRKFIQRMPQTVQEDFFAAVDRLRQNETLSRPLSRPLYDIAVGLNELRFEENKRIYRVFYYIHKQDAIYLIHAIQKKTQKLSNKDRKLILKRLKEI